MSGVNRSVPSGATEPKPICASEQAPRPSAPEGLTVTPAGSVTVVSLMLELERPFAPRLTSWGTRTCTERPVGVLAELTSGWASIEGSKASRLQPLIPSARPNWSCSAYSAFGRGIASGFFGTPPGDAFDARGKRQRAGGGHCEEWCRVALRGALATPAISGGSGSTCCAPLMGCRSRSSLQRRTFPSERSPHRCCAAWRSRDTP